MQIRIKEANLKSQMMYVFGLSYFHQMTKNWFQKRFPNDFNSL
jgi:hypothetical protein